MAEQQTPDLRSGIDAALAKEGEPVAGTVDGKPVVVVRSDGKLCAFAGECTHLGAPLADGIIVDGEIRCPWHHARFSVSTGEAVGGPAFRPLETYNVTERDGKISVEGDANRADPSGTIAQGNQKIVIIGSGGAGHACADMLARAGKGERVTILSADTDPPYDRTFCSKQYLSGKKSRKDCLLPAMGLGQAPEPTLRTGTRVTGIDPGTRQVTIGDGESVDYDILILATGATPIVPEFAGNGRDNVKTLRSLADADDLVRSANSDAIHTVAILGASFIGLEVAAAMIAHDLQVVVIAQEKLPLASVLGSEVGQFVQSLHEDEGVTFHFERSVEKFDGKTITLDDGSEVAADLLVVGAGVSPNTGLAASAGLTLADARDGGGILVDQRLTTSDGSIYAIGDVAAYPDPRLGRHIRIEHWVHAERQGRYLAQALLGQEAGDFDNIPFFWSGHYGTSLRYVGHADDPADRMIDGSIDGADFAITYQEDGKDRAVLTCGRDTYSLKVEAEWEQG